MKRKICQSCRAEIVYGFAAYSTHKNPPEYMCDECLNTMNCGYNGDGTYEPPAFFPVRQAGHC
jgi:RNase P subunit RPR2